MITWRGVSRFSKMFLSRRRTVGGILGIAAVAIAAVLTITAAGAVNHGELVGEQPRSDVPVVVDGRVFAHAQVGDRIFVGGDFLQVQRPDGSVIDQAHIFAYDIDTGLLDENFRPVLNNSVYDLQPTAAEDALYVGGRFWSWDGAFPNRIAKLAADGTLDTTFQGSADALVRSIAVTDDNVFLAGDFTVVSGAARIGFAAVDTATGAADAGFVMNVENTTLDGQYARGIVATSDGDAVFGLHFGTEINGNARPAIAKFDVSGATSSLANWSVDWFGQTNSADCLRNLRDIAISPDDSFIVVAGQGADRPPNCDSVLRYETGGTGVVPFTWSARMYSSVFSLAVSDVAVYVGGHFCAAPANGAPLGEGTHPDDGTRANLCNINDEFDPDNPSVIFPNDAVFRKQMAALNPTNGQALDWDPGSNNDLAVFDLTLIDRGLLAGHDSDRFNDFLVGRSGFFDFGVPDDTTPPSVTVDTPADGAILNAVSVIGGTATDDRTVAAVTVQVKNITTGEWLQANGATLAATQANAPTTLTDTGPGTADWSVDLATTLPPGEYEVRVFATDQVGQTTNPSLVSSFRIAGNAFCSVELNGEDQPVVSWTDFANVSNVQIRRNASWLATGAPDNGSYTDAAATPGSSFSYEVRWRPNGVVTDVPCGSITVPEPVGAACTAVLNASGHVELSWTAVGGEDTYVIRDNDGWVATVTNGALSYTDTTPETGERSYVIRNRSNGVTTDRPCDPSPITVGGGGGSACTATLNVDGHVVVNWTAVTGITNYVVRDNDGWVATVNNGGLSFTDFTPTSGERTYVIRHRANGVVVDRTCTPAPINVP